MVPRVRGGVEAAMEDPPLKKQFYAEFLRVVDFEVEGRLEQAYGLLQEFYDQHASEDAGNWLFNAVTFAQGDILRMSGDLPGALVKYRNCRYRPEDRFPYLLTSFCIARTLDALGEPREALAELQSGLDAAVDPPLHTDLGNLLLYANLTGRLGQDLPKPFLATVQKVVQLWGVPLDDDELDDGAKVAAALHAADAIRLKDRRK